MWKAVMVLAALTGAVWGQVTSLPNPSGGGGGPITAGRVAFGDGTSTAATDSMFLWDNTAKKFKVGTLPGYYNSVTPYTVQIGKVDTSNRGYDTVYNILAAYQYDTTGKVTVDASFAGDYFVTEVVGDAAMSGYVNGHNSYTKLGGSVTSPGVYGVAENVRLEGSTVTSYANVASTFFTIADTASVTNDVAIQDIDVLNYGGSVSGVMRNLYIHANTLGTSGNWNIYSMAGDSGKALNYFGGNTGIGFGSDVPTNTLWVKDGTATTGTTSVKFDIGAGQSSTSTILTLGGVIRFNGQNTTGAGSAALGSNSPAVTNSAPYTWIRAVSSDGSTVYIPAWK